MAQIRYNLTHKKVESLKCKAGQKRTQYYDNTIRGFSVRVTESGKKVYYLRYLSPVDGKQKQTQIGYHGEISNRRARTDADALRGQIAQGIDPKLADTSEPGQSFGGLARRYIEEHAKPRKKSWKTDEDRLFGPTSRLLDWHGRDVAAITRLDVRAIHKAIGDEGKNYEANRVAKLLNMVFNWAKKEGVVGDTHRDIAQDVNYFPESRRKGWLEPHHVEPFMSELLKLKSPVVIGGILFILLTGARNSSVRSLPWSSVDERTIRIEVKDTKGRDRDVELPVTETLADLLEMLRPLSETWVFPSERTNSDGEEIHVYDFKAGFKAINKKLKTEGLGAHHLRRTVSTYLEAVTGHATVKHILGHSKAGDVTLGYIQKNRRRMERALEDLEEEMFAESTVTPSDAIKRIGEVLGD